MRRSHTLRPETWPPSSHAKPIRVSVVSDVWMQRMGIGNTDVGSQMRSSDLGWHRAHASHERRHNLTRGAFWLEDA
eukprot:2333724-Rhodomonas_salina.2